MAILMNPFVGFLVVLLSTMFLVGELLVKVKGLFALIGIGLMSLFFSYHLNEMSMIWMVGLYIGGILLIVLDGKVLNDGTASVIGILLMILAVAVPSPGILYGLLAGTGVLFGIGFSFLFLKVFPKRDVWGKVTLKDRLTSEMGYNSLNDSYRELIGKQAVTLTPFKPTGTIEVDDREYSATTSGRWLDMGTEVEITAVDGTKITVSPIRDGSVSHSDDGKDRHK